MAQSGYTPILIYASGTTTNVPLAANLTSSASGAELALNYVDGKLYYKDNAGVVQTLATKSSTSGVFTSVTDSGLTSGRVTYATTGGLLTDSAGLTFDGTTLTTNKLTTTGFATLGLGAVFTGASNNATGVGVEIGYGSGSGYVQAFNRSTTAYVPIYYDGSVQSWNIGGSEKMRLDASGRLGIGTSSPTSTLSVTGTLSTTGEALIGGAQTLSYGLGVKNASATSTTTGDNKIIRLAANASGADVTLSFTDAISYNTNISAKANHLLLQPVAGTVVGDFSSTGLAVTGALSTTGDITLNGTNRVITAPGDASTSSGSIKFTTPIYGADTGASYGANGSTARILFTGGLGFYYGTTLSGATTQSMTLDNSGNLGIATTNPSGGTSSSANIKLAIGGASGGLAFNASNAAGRIESVNGNGTLTYATGASSGSAHTFIVSSSITAATIDGSGNLLVGTTDSNPASTGISGTALLKVGGVRVSASSGSSYFALTAASGTQITFYTYSAGAIAAGTIACPTTTTTTYNSVSDHRLKSNVVPLTNSGAIIDALKPRSFTWNVDGSSSVGFIADEVQAVIPNAVTGEKDAVDEDGKPVYQMLDASTPEMMAYLIAELQSLRARVAQLETKGV